MMLKVYVRNVTLKLIVLAVVILLAYLQGK